MKLSMTRRFISVLSLLLVGLPGAVWAQTGLKWAGTTQDLTADPAKSEVAATFPFSNVGQSTIEIVELVTSCGCTTASLEKKTYAPGEKGRIDVVVHYNSETSQMQQSVAIATNEPGSARYSLNVNVAVPGKRRPVERIELDPRSVDWDRGSRRAPKVVSLRIPRLDDSIRPLSAVADNEDFELVLRQPDPSDQYLYELVITPRRVDQPSQSTITILTNSRSFRPSWMPDITYRLTASVR